MVPNAIVTVTDVDRNLTVTGKTDDSGHYEFSQLNSGNYKVSTEVQGFKKTESQVLVLATQSQLRFDIQLSTGSVSESIEVTSEAPLLETERVSLDEYIGRVQLGNLPINGRNCTSLAALTPGVSTTPRPNVSPAGTAAV